MLVPSNLKQLVESRSELSREDARSLMQQIFHVQFEPALACGAMLLIVTFMCVIPVGLIWARVEHVSLKKVSEQSEHLGHDEAEQTPAVSEA